MTPGQATVVLPTATPPSALPPSLGSSDRETRARGHHHRTGLVPTRYWSRIRFRTTDSGPVQGPRAQPGSSPGPSRRPSPTAGPGQVSDTYKEPVVGVPAEEVPLR